MNGYELSRKWFDWCFENPEKISPNHSALYFFAIEHCNRLGWRKKFGFPTEMAKDAIGIKSYNTYIKTLNDLVEWGFIEMIQRSKNQYSSNIIALSNFNKALDKALDKAISKAIKKQSESTSKSIDSIDKPITIKPLTNKLENSQTELLPSLKNSNLFRTPNIPTFEDVHLAFRQNGGTEEQAKAFYGKHNGLEWFLNGTPIRNFKDLIPNFLRIWANNENKSNGSEVKNKTIRID